jgi:hypothetical protein
MNTQDNDEYIINPKTNLRVKKDCTFGRQLLQRQSQMNSEDYILNPKTNRYVKKNCPIGRDILRQLSQPEQEIPGLTELLRKIDELSVLVEKYADFDEIPGVVETWRKIILDNVEYDYEMSDFGRLRKQIPKKIIKQQLRRTGYVTCQLSKNGVTKSYSSHRLVALVFLPNPENKPCVNHINHKRHVNLLINLNWMTQPENMRHASTNPERKLTGRKIVLYAEDRITPVRSYDSIRLAARLLNIFEHSIKDVLRGNAECTTKDKYYFGYADPKLVMTDKELEQFEDMEEMLIPNYLISRDGRVYSQKSKLIMQGQVDGGYTYLTLNGTKYPVHRLVAQKFIPNPDNKPNVNHIDGTGDENGTLDNNMKNLEWATRAENAQHAVDTGLNPSGVPVDRHDLDGVLIAHYKNGVDACRALKLELNCTSQIMKCCKKYVRHAYGHIWRFPDDTTEIIPIPMKDRHSTRKRVVLQFLPDGTFVDMYKSLADAGRALKIKSVGNISSCCLKRLAHAYGFGWRYSDDIEDITDQVVASMFKLAQEAYEGTVNTERDLLKDLFTRIVKNKPSLDELCVDTVVTIQLYNILILNRQYDASSFELITVVGDALEAILNL